MAGLIEDYAIVGDMQTAALISRDGSVDWLCVPRFDSPACLAALLGDPGNGQWRISPTAADGPPSRRGTVTRRYQDSTLILETEWRTVGGTVRVIDFMPPRDDGTPVLVRIVQGVEGAVEMECVWRLRFGYGKVIPWVRRIDHCIVAVAGPDSVWMRTPVRLTGHDMAHEATFTVRAGEQVPFVFTWNPSHLGPPPQLDAAEALEQTRAFWASWSAACSYTGPYRDAVMRSLITLKALTYAPTGGVVAAATTSLPEDLGGVRNWDYRFCWLRDATITLEALLRTGYTQEASQWREWLGRAIAGDPADVQIMYGVGGERRLDEWQADWLPGYEHSAPVRIGNAAVNQRQLDVYGEVIDALTLGRQAGLRFDQHTWALVRALLRFLEQNWDQPDEGIWEVRGPRQHFVHSKVMAWVAFDRATRLAELGNPGAEERWRQVRDRIHAEVCEKGYDAKRGTFTQYYGSTELDAAVLLIPQYGFLPPEDERVVSTVETIQRELTSGGLVLRYSQPATPQNSVDGLAGGEGAFLACSFWLANALCMIGRMNEARDLFERLLSLRNDVGLLAEEYDPRYNRQVGNFPQAFSHMPLIQSALNLADHARDLDRRVTHGTGAGPGGAGAAGTELPVTTAPAP
jgi:GH15 family glucan-1,4-alpha-glucosidase